MQNVFKLSDSKWPPYKIDFSVSVTINNRPLVSYDVVKYTNRRDRTLSFRTEF